MCLLCASFFPLLGRFSTIHLHSCLTLRRVDEYSCIARTFQLMMLAIPLKDTIVALHQLYPPLLNLVLPPIFYYQLQHIFVLDRILFAQTLTLAPHLFSSGLSRMVYKHLSKCLIPKDPSSRFLELFQVAIAIVHGDIHRLVALVLGVNKLLTMAKDTSGLRFITMGKVFFSPYQSFHCPITSRVILGAPIPHQFRVSTPKGCEAIFFGIRTLLNLHFNWAMMQVDVENNFNSVSQTVIFRELCDVKGAFGEHCPLYQKNFWCSFFFLPSTWVACRRGHHY